MNFNPKKCEVIRLCTNKTFPAGYYLHPPCHILEAVDGAKYLGVFISEDLQWKSHIESIAATASRTIGFLRWNLYN